MRLRRFRFTIGQSMVVVAILALCFAFPQVPFILFLMIMALAFPFLFLLAMFTLAFLLTAPIFWIFMMIQNISVHLKTNTQYHSQGSEVAELLGSLTDSNNPDLEP